MRVFVAIDLSDEAKREVKKLHKTLKRKHWNVRWEPAEKVHLTLVFVGNIEDGGDSIASLQNDKSGKLQLIKDVVGETCRPLQSIKVEFKGLGCFPDYDWPRIIWLGLKGDLRSLAILQKKIKDNLKKAGFKVDDRPFVPHLTLGRIKRARRGERKEISRQVRAMKEIKFRKNWLIKEVVIYESKCLPEGSKYSKLFSCFLQS